MELECRAVAKKIAQRDITDQVPQSLLQNKKGQSIDCPKVAGVGLEPHDLRVMSPTSYQLLHPAMYLDLPKRNLIVCECKDSANFYICKIFSQNIFQSS